MGNGDVEGPAVGTSELVQRHLHRLSRVGAPTITDRAETRVSTSNLPAVRIYSVTRSRFVSTSGSPSVIAIVCSLCAVREPSAERMVQPSGS